MTEMTLPSNRLTKEEQETIIVYNNAEDNAIISTYDRSLINTIDAKLDEFSPYIYVIKRGEGFAEYSCPRKWIRLKFPRIIMDETRVKWRNHITSINSERKDEQE